MALPSLYTRRIHLRQTKLRRIRGRLLQCPFRQHGSQYRLHHLCRIFYLLCKWTCTFPVVGRMQNFLLAQPASLDFNPSRSVGWDLRFWRLKERSGQLQQKVCIPSWHLRRTPRRNGSSRICFAHCPRILSKSTHKTQRRVSRSSNGTVHKKLTNWLVNRRCCSTSNSKYSGLSWKLHLPKSSPR